MERREKFGESGELELEFRKLNFRAALPLLPKVGTGMLKIADGDVNFFNAFSSDDFYKLFETLCSFTDKIGPDGEKRALRLTDFNDNVDLMLPILSVFLEHNFRFFSGALGVLSKLTQKPASKSD